METRLFFAIVVVGSSMGAAIGCGAPDASSCEPVAASGANLDPAQQVSGSASQAAALHGQDGGCSSTSPDSVTPWPPTKC